MTTINDIPQPQLTLEIPSSWGADLQPAGCPVCKQAFLVPAKNLPEAACPHCFSASLVGQNVWLRNEPAELIIPFKIQPAEIEGLMTGFTKGVWLHTDDFTPQSLAKRARLVFWPQWLVDAEVNASWQTEAGYEYKVKSSQETYGDEGWRTREKVESRMRWEPRAGTLNQRYENITAPAVSDHERITNLAGAYRFDQAIPYTELHTAAVRVPDVQPDAAWPAAQLAFQKTAQTNCRMACGADQLRNFTYHPQFSSLNWTQMLLPLYVTYYTDDEGKPHRVLVNGQTGVVGGVRLASRNKGLQAATILVMVGLVLLILGGLGMAFGAMLSPLAVLGAVILGAGFLVCASAIVPAVWPWQWNRKQPHIE